MGRRHHKSRNLCGGRLAVSLHHLLMAAGYVVVLARIENRKAQVSGAGSIVAAVQVLIGHPQTASHLAPVRIGIGKIPCGVEVPGAHDVHEVGTGHIAVDRGYNLRGECGSQTVLCPGVPGQGINPLLNQGDSDLNIQNIVFKLFDFLPQELIGVGLGNGGALYAGGAITDFIDAGATIRLIGVLVVAHVVFDQPDTGFTHGEPSCFRRNGRSRNQAEEHHKRQQQACNSLFHRNLLLYSIVSYWYYNSIGYKLQPLNSNLFTFCNFYFYHVLSGLIPQFDKL